MEESKTDQGITLSFPDPPDVSWTKIATELRAIRELLEKLVGGEAQKAPDQSKFITVIAKPAFSSEGKVYGWESEIQMEGRPEVKHLESLPSIYNKEVYSHEHKLEVAGMIALYDCIKQLEMLHLTPEYKVSIWTTPVLRNVLLTGSVDLFCYETNRKKALDLISLLAQCPATVVGYGVAKGC